MNEESLLKIILDEAREKIQEEISGLLGKSLTLEAPRIQPASKKNFFAEASRKLVLTRVAIEGEMEGEVFLFTPLRDAILLGGTLIMLPPSELESRTRKEEFGEEENDAFGEIANIIAGVVNSLFEEYYPKKLRFKKTALQPLNTGKINPDAAEPFPPQMFLQGSFAVKFEEQTLGTLDILFPELLYAVSAAEPPATNPSPQTPQAMPLPAAETRSSTPRVLIVAEPGSDITELSATLRSRAIEPTCLSIQDDARESLRDKEVRGIFLVMKEVTEQGFAAAIRIRSAAPENVPLIAAGPHWTRTTVLQAVKFGIRDILVTPATSEEIQEKLSLFLAAGNAVSSQP